MPSTVVLPNGMTVSCLQKHEVALVRLEVEGYLSNGLELRPGDTLFDVGANIGLFSVCGGEKLGHGSGGICPAAGGVKLCHL